MGLLVVALVALPACGGSSGAATRTILTDYNHDQFATSVFGYFPQFAEVHPGDRIVFKQAWTGEAHTVTFGTLVQPLGDIVKPYFSGEKAIPTEGEPPGLEEASRKLPSFFGDKGVNQTAAQPCYLASGSLPGDGKPCKRVAQPAFTGREPFYSSGFIPYAGNDGNRFAMDLSKSIKPGDYFYYCLLHGAGMAGWLRVKPTTSAITQDRNRVASSEIGAAVKDFRSTYNKTKSGDTGLPPDVKVDVVAGAFPPETTKIFGFVDEFFPKMFTAKVGQKVTWFVAAHSVAFDVPKYGPQLKVDGKTGEVTANDRAYKAVGMTIPEPTSESEDAPPVEVDGGRYDGSKFISTGVPDGAILFSLTFTKAGTYQYACTIHPRMVGTIAVKA